MKQNSVHRAKFKRIINVSQRKSIPEKLISSNHVLHMFHNFCLGESFCKLVIRNGLWFSGRHMECEYFGYIQKHVLAAPLAPAVPH